MAQFEEGFHSANMELKEQIKLLQVILNQKEEHIKEITQNLVDALKRVERERKKQKRRTDYMCAITWEKRFCQDLSETLKEEHYSQKYSESISYLP